MTNTLHIKTSKIDQYMRDIEQYPRLTHQEERELYNLMHGDDPAKADAAREKLICCNLRLVVSLAHQFKRYKIEFNDLVQVGTQGLMLAADKFDPDRCEKFSIVAASWIKHSMRKNILDCSRTVRLPSGAAQLAARVARVRHAYEAEFGQLPTDEYVAEQLGVSVLRVQGTAVSEITIASMDEKVSEDSDTTFSDMICETVTNDDDTPSDMTDCLHDINTLIGRMSAKDQFLIKHSYGLGCESASIDILSQETGMSVRCIKGRLYSIYQHLNEVLHDKGYDY